MCLGGLCSASDKRDLCGELGNLCCVRSYGDVHGRTAFVCVAPEAHVRVLPLIVASFNT